MLSTGRHQFDVDGLPIAYQVHGRGPVCLAHPGGPGFNADYLHSAELEHLFTVVYLDPIGTGASGRLGGAASYSLARDVAVLEALRAHLAVDRPCVLGHSYGGMVVQRYALDHPGHVGELILYSTSPTNGEEFGRQMAANMATYKAQPWFAGVEKGQQLEAAASTDAEALQGIKLQLPIYFADWSTRGAEYQARLETTRLSVDVERRRDDGAFDVRAELKRLTVPTLILAGDHDFICGLVPSRWIHDQVPSAKLVVIEHAGHFAHLEQPEAFSRAITEFIASLPK